MRAKCFELEVNKEKVHVRAEEEGCSRFMVRMQAQDGAWQRVGYLTGQKRTWTIEPYSVKNRETQTFSSARDACLYAVSAYMNCQ